MTTFRRTNQGINNQHLFYNVDLIVFTEGGELLTIAQAYAGECDEDTEDILFWKNIFKKFLSRKKIKFKSVGSKTVVLEIAKDIHKGKLINIYAAMDCEFDEIKNTKINHPNIIYTHGYSWENDIWDHKTICEVIKMLSGHEPKKELLEKNFNLFLKNIKPAVYADGYLFNKNKEGFFQRRGGHLFCIECSGNDLPTVKAFEINEKLKSKSLNKRTLYSFGGKYSINTLKFCFGHLLAKYCYQLITKYLNKEHSLKNISPEYIFRIGISKFFETSFKNGAIYKYFQTQFNR